MHGYILPMILTPRKKPGKAQPGVLRLTFNIASTADMQKLGAAFGRAVVPHAHEGSQPDEVVRIGLSSNNQRNLGKSTFGKALVGEIPDLDLFEFADDSQFTGYSPQSGTVRFYDCNFSQDWALPSYYANDLTHCSGARTDIVEHPYHDRHDRKFQYMVYFGYAEPWYKVMWDQLMLHFENPRRVTVDVPAEMGRSGNFQRFVAETSQWLERSKDQSGPKPNPQTGLYPSPGPAR